MENKTDTAIAKPYALVTQVAAQLRKYEERKELILPPNYSIENALKSAWLILQETTDKDKMPVLHACSQASIANALLDMAVQGLNPGKKQCYFIAYGKKLLCQRSYFGTMAVAERVAGAVDIWAEDVYQNDEFEYTITHNRKTIAKHTQRLGNIKPGNITAAYCVIEFGSAKPSYTEIMTIEQIHTAWAKSKTNPEAPTSTHSLYPEEMCKRTVINRACKKLINSSSDDNLFLQSFQRADDETAEAEITTQIEENANQEFLDLGAGPDEIVEEQPGEPQSPKPAPSTPKPKRDPASIKTIADMEKACKDDFGLSEAQVMKELNVKSSSEIVKSPWDCYLQIAAVMPRPQTGGEPGF